MTNTWAISQKGRRVTLVTYQKRPMHYTSRHRPRWDIRPAPLTHYEAEARRIAANIAKLLELSRKP